MNKLFTPKFIFVASALLIAAFSRLIPHPFNFTPIAGMALFGGALLNDKKLAVAIPLVAMLISDIIIGFHDQMLGVYISFIMISFIGFWLSSNYTAGKIVLASLSSSLFFFLVTNFYCWLIYPMYTKDLAGLILAYTLAIPFYTNDVFGSFFVNTILADLFYTSALFGAYHLATFKFPVLAKA
jgi:hypothetical protein